MNVLKLSKNFEERNKKYCSWTNPSKMNIKIILLIFLTTLENSVTASFDEITKLEREHDIKRNIMNHLKMDKIPVFSRHEYDNFQVPNHVRDHYDYLLNKHQRNRRASGSLANLYHSVRENPGM